MLMLAGALLWSTLCAAPARAEVSETEFLSVSTPSAWVREEPRSNAPTLWKVWHYAPVEVVSYRADWVRIRDFEGDEGWLPRDVLSDVPTVLVSAKEGKVRTGRSSKAKIEWILDRGYPLRVFSVKDDWLEVSDLEDVSGWIHRSAVWGFPPVQAPH